MTRSDKERLVADLSTQLREAKATVITEYRGTTVAQMDDIRRKLAEAGIAYKVAKNSLLKRAFEKAGIEPTDPSLLDLPIALAVGDADEVAVAKAVTNLNREIETILPKAGIMNGEYVSESTVKRLSLLPGREELYGKIAGSLGGLTTRMVRTLNNPLQGLVTALGQIKEKGTVSFSANASKD